MSANDVVHSVHYTVAVGVEVVGPLEYPGQYKEDLFRELAHGKSAMGRISMEEKGLKEEGEVPVAHKEGQDNNH